MVISNQCSCRLHLLLILVYYLPDVFDAPPQWAVTLYSRHFLSPSPMFGVHRAICVQIIWLFLFSSPAFPLGPSSFGPKHGPQRTLPQLRSLLSLPCPEGKLLFRSCPEHSVYHLGITNCSSGGCIISKTWVDCSIIFCTGAPPYGYPHCTFHIAWYMFSLFLIFNSAN